MENEVNKMTPEELKKMVLKDIDKDEIMYKAISGIIQCNEKMGISMEETLDTITKAMDSGLKGKI